MDRSPLELLFERHFADSSAELRRFRDNLAAAGLNFDVEQNVDQIVVSNHPGLPSWLPPFVFYFVSGTGYGSVRPASGHESILASHMGTSDGIGLNFGCPIRLHRALNVLFSLNLEDRHEPLLLLRAARTHFAAVEELLWLTLWKQPSAISRGGELANTVSVGKRRDIDWFFVVEGQPIYLEAKFRPTDWMRGADQRQGVVQDNFFRDIGSKFPMERSTFRKCVAGITGYAETDDGFFYLAERKLISTPGFDAILYRSLLGPITICGLDPDTVFGLGIRLQYPDLGEYPPYYWTNFNRLLQQKRMEVAKPKAFPEKGLLYCAIVPGPVPKVTMQYPVRFSIPKWKPDGRPEFAYVPPLLPVEHKE